MIGSRDHDVWRQKDMIADLYLSSVHDGDIIVDEGVFADRDVFSVITMKTRIDRAIFSDFKERINDEVDKQVYLKRKCFMKERINDEAR